MQEFEVDPSWATLDSFVKAARKSLRSQGRADLVPYVNTLAYSRVNSVRAVPGLSVEEAVSEALRFTRECYWNLYGIRL